MKLFKKLFSVLVLCIGCVILAASAGCNTLPEGDGWTEVQSITYTTENGTTTLTSSYRFNVTTENIEQVEYDSAPDEYKHKTEYADYYSIWLEENSIISKGSLIDEADSKVGNTHYYCLYHINYDKLDENNPNNFNPADYIEIDGYKKIVIDSYSLNYVKVKIISDKVIEIDFKDKVKQVSTISYEITYFEN